MLQKSRELIYAVIAMILITLAYLLVQEVYGEVPSASSLWGHSIGVIGFLLMLMTETLYSLRKRSRRAYWGKMANWLEFHIFTGLVGPFMVLLHPGWQFKGLAGVLSLLTILIVISGFIGRYIYTAIPRTADGVELDVGELQHQVNLLELRLQGITGVQNPGDEELSSGVKNTVLTAFSGAGRATLEVPGTLYSRATLRNLRREQDRLNRAIARRQTARRLFSLWHTIHIPMGLTLFLIAFIHIGATIYYAVLLR